MKTLAEVLGPWRTILLAGFAVAAVVVVVYLDRPETVSKQAIDTIAMIAGGGALYRYLADRKNGDRQT